MFNNLSSVTKVNKMKKLVNEPLKMRVLNILQVTRGKLRKEKRFDGFSVRRMRQLPFKQKTDYAPRIHLPFTYRHRGGQWDYDRFTTSTVTFLP